MSEHANPNDTSDAFSRAAEQTAQPEPTSNPRGPFDFPEAGVRVEDPETGLEELGATGEFGVPVEDGVPVDNNTEQDGEEDSDEPQIPADVDNPSSYKYYQSRFHRAEQENQALQERLQQVENYLGQLASGQPAVTQPPVARQQQGAPQSQDSLRMPEKPQLPDNFDETDAFYDPDSESYKYRIAQTQYQEELARFLDQRLGQMNQQLEQVQAREQQRAREQAWRQQLSETYGMDESDQEAFMDFLNDPGQLTLPNMVKMYYATHGGQPMRQPQRRPKTPLPPTPQPSSTAQGASRRESNIPVEDRIINGMKKINDPTAAAFGDRG